MIVCLFICWILLFFDFLLLIYDGSRSLSICVSCLCDDKFVGKKGDLIGVWLVNRLRIRLFGERSKEIVRCGSGGCLRMRRQTT